MKLIGFIGYAGAGKDEAGRALKDWTRVSFADPLREGLLALNPLVAKRPDTPVTGRLVDSVHSYGWDVVKQWPDVRRLLQRYGTEAGRDIHGQDCWVRIARAKILATRGPVYVSDVRFMNELHLIQELGGVTVHIQRPGVGPVNQHKSDVDMPIHLADYTIVNDGDTQQLHDKVLTLVQELEGEQSCQISSPLHLL